MKLYLDENISPRAAKKLREKGFDVISAHQILMQSKSDIEQLEFAINEKRAVVTYDIVDFVELAKDCIARSKAHYGIILVSNKTIPQGNLKKLTLALEKLLREAGKEKDYFKNKVIYLTA